MKNKRRIAELTVIRDELKTNERFRSSFRKWAARAMLGLYLFSGGTALAESNPDQIVRTTNGKTAAIYYGYNSYGEEYIEKVEVLDKDYDELFQIGEKDHYIKKIEKENQRLKNSVQTVIALAFMDFLFLGSAAIIDYVHKKDQRKK